MNDSQTRKNEGNRKKAVPMMMPRFLLGAIFFETGINERPEEHADDKKLRAADAKRRARSFATSGRWERNTILGEYVFGVGIRRGGRPDGWRKNISHKFTRTMRMKRPMMVSRSNMVGKKG